ncbi:MAG: hypothetical protein AB7P34_05435 [Vicinamibacterales bacterium]
MRKTFSSVTLLAAGVIAAGTISLGAQTPTPQQTPAPQETQAPRPQPPTTTAAPRASADAVLKLTGCLKEEKDVAGLKPNVVERAGITEDYILTNVKAAADSQVSGLAVGSMYEVEGIAEAELKKHLNHQVEITGNVANAAAGARNRDDVPDFRATSLRMLAATCPAK